MTARNSLVSFVVSLSLVVTLLSTCSSSASVGVSDAELDASCAYYAADAYNSQSTFLPGWAHEFHISFGVDELKVDGYESDLHDFVIAVRSASDSFEEWRAAARRARKDLGLPLSKQSHQFLTPNTLVNRHVSSNSNSPVPNNGAAQISSSAVSAGKFDRLTWSFAERLLAAPNSKSDGSADSLFDAAREQCRLGHRLTLTGHSHGGSVATLLAWHIRYKFPHCPLTLVTFGSPAVMTADAAVHFRELDPPIDYRRYVTRCFDEPLEALDVLNSVKPQLTHPVKALVLQGNGGVTDAEQFMKRDPEMKDARRSLQLAKRQEDILPPLLWQETVQSRSRLLKGLEREKHMVVGLLCHFPDNYFDALQRYLRIKEGIELRWCTSHGLKFIPGAAIVNRWQHLRRRHLHVSRTWPRSASYRQWAHVTTRSHGRRCPRHTPQYAERSSFVRTSPLSAVGGEVPASLRSPIATDFKSANQIPMQRTRKHQHHVSTSPREAEAEESLETYLDDFDTFNPAFQNADADTDSELSSPDSERGLADEPIQPRKTVHPQRKHVTKTIRKEEIDPDVVHM